jgi:hypothetical protein
MKDLPGDFFERAYDAERRYCARHNYQFQEPSAPGEIDGNVITLFNMHGTIARYRWTGHRVERLEDEA